MFSNNRDRSTLYSKVNPYRNPLVELTMEAKKAKEAVPLKAMKVDEVMVMGVMVLWWSNYDGRPICYH